MQLRIGDQITDEAGTWQVIARPYSSAGGKNTQVRVQRMDQPGTTDTRLWGAYERVPLRRASDEAIPRPVRHTLWSFKAYTKRTTRAPTLHEAEPRAQFLECLQPPRGWGGGEAAAVVLARSQRPARLATIVTNSVGSTGLGACMLNPADIDRRRSSALPYAVRATAGTLPALSASRLRTF